MGSEDSGGQESGGSKAISELEGSDFVVAVGTQHIVARNWAAFLVYNLL
jgi:hypothetical protein